MKEITEEVINATYPKPLGRGLLRWRVDDLDTERGETKHIVELDNGDIVYVRKLGGSVLVTDIDMIYGLKGATFVGLPECLGVNHAFLYSSQKEDPVALQMGMSLRTVTMRKDGGVEQPCPDGFEKDVVLTDTEMAELMKEADNSEAMRVALGDLARGSAYLCRVKSTLGDALMIVDRDSDGGVSLNCYNVKGAQDVLRVLDCFDYLVSTAHHGYYNATYESDASEVLALYMTNKGFKPQTTVYAISATPKGE